MRMSPLAQKLPVSRVSTPELANSRRLTAWCAPDNPWQGRHFGKHAMLGQALRYSHEIGKEALTRGYTERGYRRASEVLDLRR